MAPQHSTVTILRVTFKLVIECCVRGFRSQHRVNKYNNSPNNERISSAAGAEPKIPKLCEYKHKKEKKREREGEKCVT